LTFKPAGGGPFSGIRTVRHLELAARTQPIESVDLVFQYFYSCILAKARRVSNSGPIILEHCYDFLCGKDQWRPCEKAAPAADRAA
jgi:hypothetical protein